MKKPQNNILTYKEKQRILYLDKTPKEELIKWGNFYLEKDLIYDAFEFFKVAGDGNSLKSLLNQAKSEGNFFLFNSIASTLKQDISAGEWDEIGKIAEQKEKNEFALKAYEKAGNDRKIEEINRMLNPEEGANEED